MRHKIARPAILRNRLCAATFGASYLSWFLLDRKNILGVGPATEEDSRTHRHLVVSGAAGLCLALAFSVLRPYQMRCRPECFGYTGVSMIWVGIGLRQWAMKSLGQHWTPMLAAPPDDLVTRGPYRVLRHPSYTGALTSNLGIGIALGSWASLLSAGALPLLGIVSRIRAEERILRDASELDYEAFARNRAKLVPAIW